jgi:hypothetical protein
MSSYQLVSATTLLMDKETSFGAGQIQLKIGLIFS